MIRNLLSILLHLLPAAYAWWSGRRLLGRLDDPLFPELHFARYPRLWAVFLISMVAGLLVSVELAWAKFLVAALALAVVGHGYRKRVHDETWSLLGYVSHFLRLLAGLFGTWILIGVTPKLIAGSGAAALPVAIAIAAAVVAASLFDAPLMRRLLGAKPLVHPDLEARFEKILDRAACRRPAVFHAGPEGGFWVNALALPSFGRPAVVLSDDLLANLGPREVAAIFAHEVAHLEEHLRGFRLATGHLMLWTLAAVALAVPFALGPSTAAGDAFTALWPLAVLLWLGVAASLSQAGEHRSDLRALELCGDAPALIDALTKLHVLSHQPRRWGLRSEVGMTHPSLAQRLRAVREAAIRDGLTRDPLTRDEPAGGQAVGEAASTEIPDFVELAVRAADGSDRAVVLAADRIHWLDGVPSADRVAGEQPRSGVPDPAALRDAAPDCRSILYSDLVDLRLDPVRGRAGARSQRLVASDRRGHTLQLSVRTADVRRVQAALEGIEHALPGLTPGLSELAADRSTRSVLVRLVALVLTVLGFVPAAAGSLSLAALLVVVRPAAATLAAAGAIAVAAALAGARDLAAPEGGGTPPSTVGLLFLAGIYLLFLALRRYGARLAEPRWVTWGGVGLLAFSAALSVAVGLLRLAQPHPADELHRWAREGPGPELLLVGLAAMLFTVRRRAARLAAVVALVAAAGLAVVSASWFGDRFSSDPFNLPLPRLAVAEPALEEVRHLQLAENPRQLALSPSGRLATSTDFPDFDGRWRPEPAVAEALGPDSLLGRYGAPVVALRAGLLAVAVHGREGSPVVVYRVPEDGSI